MSFDILVLSSITQSNVLFTFIFFNFPRLFETISGKMYITILFVNRTRAIISSSILEAALEYKPYIRTKFSEKNLLKNKDMVFGNGVKNIQAAAYNGARTVYKKIVNTHSFFVSYIFLDFTNKLNLCMTKLKTDFMFTYFKFSNSNVYFQDQVSGDVRYESRSEMDIPLETLNLAEKDRFMKGKVRLK